MGPGSILGHVSSRPPWPAPWLSDASAPQHAFDGRAESATAQRLIPIKRKTKIIDCVGAEFRAEQPPVRRLSIQIVGAEFLVERMASQESVVMTVAVGRMT